MDLGPYLTGGGVSAAVAFVIVGAIKAIDVFRKTGHAKETDLIGQLNDTNVRESARNQTLAERCEAWEAKYDKLRGRMDDTADQNAALRRLLILHEVPIPPDLADAP